MTGTTSIAREENILAGFFYNMNTYTKGNRIEKLFRDMMQTYGWLTWKPSRARFNSNDVFGLFDVVMARGSKIQMVQIKSNLSHFYHARKEIAQWVVSNHLHFSPLCALYEGRGEWRIEQYDYANYEWLKYTLTKA